MSTETKSTARYRNPTKQAGRGKIKAKRWNVNTTAKDFTPAVKYDKAFFQNSGSVDILIYFNDDTDYYTLKAGTVSPTIQLNDTVVIYFKTASGSSTLEAIVWG
jgi:hypothetical protein